MKKLGPLFIILALFSCGRNNVAKQLTTFIGSQIVIPENMQANYRGTDTLIQSTAAPLKLVVWYDSLVCSSCQIQKIYEWDEVVSYGETTDGIFEPLFIFSPRSSDLHSVNLALRSSRFDHHVYIDKEGAFYKDNPGIPSDKRMHTFLMDENNRVVMVGSPVNNEKLWDLYKEQVENKRSGAVD